MTYGTLLERTRCFQESRVLLTGIELDIFSAVGRGARAAEVAGRIGANPRAAEMLLNALTALGALTKRRDVFRNTPVTRRCFTGRPSQSERAAFLHTVNLWNRWSTLTEAVRTGRWVWPGEQAAQGRWVETFIAAMHRNAIARAPKVVRAVGVKGVKRMLDVGGGSGAYSIAFAQAAPALVAEVLDRPEVLPIARRHIATAGLARRVTARSGDLRSDLFGEGYDLVLVSAICHMLSPAENLDLFRRIYGALAPGGEIVVQDFILKPDKTAPRAGALFALNMLVATEAGSSYSQPEYASWLKEAGFTKIRRIRLEEPAGLMVGVRRPTSSLARRRPTYGL